MNNSEAEALDHDVQELFKVQDKMKEIAAQAKEMRDPLKDRQDVLQDRIKFYMSSRNLGDIEYPDQMLVYKEVTRGLSLCKKSLTDALDDYFENDKEASKECLDFILNHIGTRQVVVLSRRAIKEKKAKASKNDSDSDEVNETFPDLVDDAPPELNGDE